VRIQLTFTEDYHDLQLERIAVWDSAASESATPDRELFAAVDADLGSKKQLFRWTAAVRAFCVLMLRAYRLPDPLAADLVGGEGSAARSLVDLVRKCSASDDLNWIQYLFQPILTAHAQGLRLSHDVFKPKSNSKARHFSIHLGPRWRHAQILIQNGTRTVELTEARQMAELLDALFKQPEPEARKRLTGDVELFAWNARRQQLAPIETTGLPLSVQSGVSLHITLSRSAYPYVIWITSARVVQPLYPWEDFDWKKRSPTAPRVELRLPPARMKGGSGFYPLHSRPGIETALVLAREKPASQAEVAAINSICRSLLRYLPKALPDVKQVYWLRDPRSKFFSRSAFRLGGPQKIDNPMEKWADEAVGHLGGSFPCIYGVSFSTRNDD
jgi:hypothetical protein